MRFNFFCQVVVFCLTHVNLQSMERVCSLRAGRLLAFRRNFSSEVNIFELHRRFAAVMNDLSKPGVGNRLLQVVATQGTPEEAVALIKMGANPNQRSAHGGYTPLHKAASFNTCQMVSVLVDLGADVHAVTDGKTSMELAEMHRSNEDIDKLRISLFLASEMAKKA